MVLAQSLELPAKTLPLNGSGGLMVTKTSIPRHPDRRSAVGRRTRSKETPDHNNQSHVHVPAMMCAMAVFGLSLPAFLARSSLIGERANAWLENSCFLTICRRQFLTTDRSLRPGDLFEANQPCRKMDSTKRGLLIDDPGSLRADHSNYRVQFIFEGN